MNSNDSATLRSSEKALRPYLEAAATCQNVAAMRAVVAKVLQEPELFAGYDQIKAALLKAAENAMEEKVVNTLDLFSYGTVTDYQRTPGTYLVLTDAQLAKLRQLTVLNLIEDACLQQLDKVPYTAIQQALLVSYNNTNNSTDSNTADPKQQLRETEQILSQLLAARVVTGKLSQKEAALVLKTGGTDILVRPRDVHPATVTQMLQALRQMRVKLIESNDAISREQANVLKALENEKAALQQAETKWKDKGSSFSAAGVVHGEPMFEDLNRPASAAGVVARGSFARRQKRSRGGFTSSNNSMPEPPGGASSSSSSSWPFGL